MKKVELYCCGEVSAHGADLLLDKLQAAGADDEILLHIDSNGGQFRAAMDLYQRIKAHRGTVIAQINGAAYSAAATVAMAADRRIMRRSATMLLHPPYVEDPYDWDGFPVRAHLLQDAAWTVKQLVCDATGMFESAVVKLMTKGEPLSSSQCLALGLCDEIIADRIQDGKKPLLFRTARGGISRVMV